MPERVLKTENDVAKFVALMGEQKLPITVTWKQGHDRTRAQNRLQWKWCGEIAEQLGDRYAIDVQAELKLIIGVPILREEPDFRDKYDAKIRPLDYDDKIALMRDWDFPVTRLMNVRQMVRYMDAISEKFTRMGIDLTQPDRDLDLYMNRYREKPEGE